MIYIHHVLTFVFCNTDFHLADATLTVGYIPTGLSKNECGLEFFNPFSVYRKRGTLILLYLYSSAINSIVSISLSSLKP